MDLFDPDLKDLYRLIAISLVILIAGVGIVRAVTGGSGRSKP